MLCSNMPVVKSTATREGVAVNSTGEPLPCSRSDSSVKSTRIVLSLLINVAKRGDRDAEAMKIADFWLKDKKQIHKLFKVLGTRFEDTSKNFTRLLRVPGFHDEMGRKLAFLEFTGNPYPALTSEPKKNPDWILNILVQGAVDELKISKALEEIEVVTASDKQYRDSLEGIQHMVDLMAMADLTDPEGRSVKGRKNEGTPV